MRCINGMRIYTKFFKGAVKKTKTCLSCTLRYGPKDVFLPEKKYLFWGVHSDFPTFDNKDRSEDYTFELNKTFDIGRVHMHSGFLHSVTPLGNRLRRLDEEL